MAGERCDVCNGAATMERRASPYLLCKKHSTMWIFSEQFAVATKTGLMQPDANGKCSFASMDEAYLYFVAKHRVDGWSPDFNNVKQRVEDK